MTNLRFEASFNFVLCDEIARFDLSLGLRRICLEDFVVFEVGGDSFNQNSLTRSAEVFGDLVDNV